jgi:hypothetical protein
LSHKSFSFWVSACLNLTVRTQLCTSKSKWEHTNQF